MAINPPNYSSYGFEFPPVVNVVGTDGLQRIVYRTPSNAKLPQTPPTPLGMTVHSPVHVVEGLRYEIEFRQALNPPVIINAPTPPNPPPTPVPSPAPPPPPVVTPTPIFSSAVPDSLRWGVNLEQNILWGKERRYKDLVKTITAFDTPGNRGDGKAALQPTGWPAGDFSVVLIQGGNVSDAGVYSVVFIGKAQVSVIGGGAMVLSTTFNGAITRAQVKYSGSVDSLSLTFSQTAGARVVKVLRPGVSEESEAAESLTDDFINLMKSLAPGVIRFMDPLETNNVVTAKWADRSTPVSPTFSSVKNRMGAGICYEWMCHICNVVGADLWINLPVTADLSHRALLAAFLHSNLRSDLRVYTEFGNENWNDRLGSHRQNIPQAQALRSQRGYDSNDEIAGWEHTADEGARIGATFRSVLGADRVRPILAGQATNLDTFNRGMIYLQGTGVDPRQAFWGLAIAPYSALTPELAANDWRVTLLATGQKVNAFYALATTSNLKSCCYEAGVDLSTSTAGQLDPRMESILLSYLTGWKGTGPLVYYRAAAPADVPYGLTTDSRDLNQPKLKAGIAYRQSFH